MTGQPDKETIQAATVARMYRFAITDEDPKAIEKLAPRAVKGVEVDRTKRIIREMADESHNAPIEMAVGGGSVTISGDDDDVREFIIKKDERCLPPILE